MNPGVPNSLRLGGVGDEDVLRRLLLSSEFRNGDGESVRCVMSNIDTSRVGIGLVGKEFDLTSVASDIATSTLLDVEAARLRPEGGREGTTEEARLEKFID